MDMNDFVSSEYLKADDLKGRSLRATIAAVTIEQLGQARESKPVVSFVGRNKRLVLNKTNTRTLIAGFGAESSGWVGQTVELYAAEVELQGRPTLGVRLRVSAQKASATPAPTVDSELNDDIDF